MRAPLEIPPVLVSDDTNKSVPGYVDMDKARIWEGLPQTIGGWETYGVAALSGYCRTVFSWGDNVNVLNIACGTNSKLQLLQSGGLYDITPSSGFTAGNADGTGGTGWGTGAYSTGNYSQPSATDYFPLTWSLDAYGQTLIGCPRNQGVFQWSNVTGTPAALVTNAPTQNTFVLVTPQRQIVVLGTKESVSGNFNPLCIRGSDIENPTVWTPASTNNAFENRLEGGGRLVGGRVLADTIFAWTDSALWWGRYVGDPGQTWDFRKYGKNCGLIGPNAAVTVGQTAYWMSPDFVFYSCSLGGVPQRIDCPIQKTLADNFAASQQDKVVAASVTKFGEVWWFYPDSRDGFENSRYVSLSLITGKFNGRGTLARTAFVDAGPAISAPVGVDTSGNVYYHERNSGAADGSAFSWYWETGAQYLGDGQMMTVKGLWPDFKDQAGALSLTLYTRLWPQSSDRTRGPWMASPGQARRSFMATGRLVRLRVSGNAVPTYARLGRPEIELEPAGEQ